MLTAERLREILDYNPETGEFKWLVTLSNRAEAGSLAGTTNDSGYRIIKIDGRDHRAHRLAWLYVTGEWPKQLIDHINTDKSDNRFSNLREATHSENHRNRKKPVTNTSGFKGVSWSSHCQRWLSKIDVDGRQKYIGLFDTPEAAHAAYVSAAEELHGKFSRAD